MSAAPELLPGFTGHVLQGANGNDMYAAVGGAGPPLLLLHGYPETHLCWHKVAPRLAAHFRVVAPDLRGYGRSACPPSDPAHVAYAKRTMAADMVAVMGALGHRLFTVMGHDRGARVAYRLALDHSECVRRLVLLDIVSTLDQWAAHEQQVRLKMFHWAFLAQPAPMPEALIQRDPDDWLESRFKRRTKARSLQPIDPRALADYRASLRDPDRIHATCEDFRAGAHIDLDHDRADRARGKQIACPTFVVWANDGPLMDMPDVLGLWRAWCDTADGVAIDCGHFIPEEEPDGMLSAVLPFLLADAETP